ncbi:WecB/TagA/CpsF family glycosyltransferase [Alkalibacterium olivapovliticus]|uniref:N-acetylglucosaminyldiphosphoundecaprenol N-acetyl-beta-D-mannosaminyltransferase n=1 Tax=Alkalibacterium olivapovliticus TaxID=99907 RepID=A0A2T0WAD3_9LACT|nr:WecB/TagA/CpsF family glycosyltransferase [Alkalibacterium olivapovliticus]PRY83474.1 N-acetylglucosaminyldiphosphoundecaprenol N-acetyl-beta-D-mannosaminyltransferase [Alkalibacterium olivapovliticus]
MQNKITILGIPFDNLTRKEFLKQLYTRMENNDKTFLVTANPEIVMYALENPSYYNLLMEADYIAPDGIGIVRASKKLETPIKERVPGFELMLGLLEIANIDQKRVYFIGAKEDILDLTLKNVKEKWPDLVIAGSHHGYFDHDDPVMIQRVKASQPDIVLVAFGFPRQEKWIKTYLSKADKGIAVGVGGSFDVLSGKTKRAPFLVQRFHIEWLYRLIKQPSRYKRMLALPYFIKAVNKQHKQEESS